MHVKGEIYEPMIFTEDPNKVTLGDQNEDIDELNIDADE